QQNAEPDPFEPPRPDERLLLLVGQTEGAPRDHDPSSRSSSPRRWPFLLRKRSRRSTHAFSPRGTAMTCSLRCSSIPVGTSPCAGISQSGRATSDAAAASPAIGTPPTSSI